MQDMATATLTLPLNGYLATSVALADPFGILGSRAMGAGAAVDLFGQAVAVAELMSRTPLALIPARVNA
jgi:hypothetical protein